MCSVVETQGPAHQAKERTLGTHSCPGNLETGEAADCPGVGGRQGLFWLDWASSADGCDREKPQGQHERCSLGHSDPHQTELPTMVRWGTSRIWRDRRKTEELAGDQVATKT